MRLKIQKIQRAVPAVPQRSEKRVSQMLDNVMLQLKNLDGSTEKKIKGESVEADPLDMYL